MNMIQKYANENDWRPEVKIPIFFIIHVLNNSKIEVILKGRGSYICKILQNIFFQIEHQKVSQFLQHSLGNVFLTILRKKQILNGRL